MSPLPSADHIAHAIVAAARACDEDPIAVASNAPRSHARTYAYLALRKRFPHAPIMRLAERCGTKKPSSLIASASSSPRLCGWWSNDVLAQVVAAIPAGPRSMPDIAQPAPVRAAPAPRPVEPAKASGTDSRVEIRRPVSTAPVMNLNPVVRRSAPARSTVSLTASIAGDPPPGRSALDQGARAGDGIAKERF